ncbi:hypothetical protein [Roseomonas chloroacetimidivorans]|uniref:hypothetical protein n=1 Tax=Roseomonas chloroacetimidivorans TaxID=1766656 RepID=UPI003C73B32F
MAEVTSESKRRGRPKAEGWRLTRYAMSDVALSRVAVFRPLGHGASSKRQSVADMMRTGGGAATADEIEIDDPQLGPIKVGFTSLPMGAREEDLLLVLMALAGMAGTKAAPRRLIGGSRSARDDARDGSRLFADAVSVMRTEGDSLRGDIYLVRVPQGLVINAWRGRKATGRDYEDLIDSLERLQSIQYSVSGLNGNRRWREGSSGLLSYSIIEEPEAADWHSQKGEKAPKNLRVTLSERMARVILGWEPPKTPKGRGRPPVDQDLQRFFVRVDLQQRFSLDGEPARLVHRYLSSIVREPRGARPVVSKPIKLATIMRVIWGPHPEPTLDQRLARRDPDAAAKALRDAREQFLQEIRDNRATLRNSAFAQIQALPGWHIEEVADAPHDDPAVIVTRTKTGPARPPEKQLQEVLGLEVPAVPTRALRRPKKSTKNQLSFCKD